MTYRIIPLALLVLASAATAQDAARDAYKHAKRLRGDAKARFAAEKAAELSGSVSGGDLLYLGLLWGYAGDAAKEADALGRFLDSGEAAANRPMAMVGRVRALAELRQWDKASSQAEMFFAQFPDHKYQAQMRFAWGRALRMLGRAEQALQQFRISAKIGYVHASAEVVDCLLQLSRYDEAVAEARQKKDDKGCQAVVAAAASFGKPLPKLPFDYWTRTELAMAELKDRPTVFAFWSTLARRANEASHATGNELAKRFGGKINVVGPTVYAKFDPTAMRVVDTMTPKEEQGFVDAWAEQYKVAYPLALLTDTSLHGFCGLDAEHPTLPAFAITDKKGNLRYVRIGPEPWALEAVEAMTASVAGE